MKSKRLLMNLERHNNNSKYALDTNILVYALDIVDCMFPEIAIALITPEAYISNHVFQEFLFQLHKARRIEKRKTFKLALKTLNIMKLSSVNKDTYRYAYHLMTKYGFQLSDSIIVSDAILNNCNILYSRDMQHNQKVDNKIIIINPFLLQ